MEFTNFDKKMFAIAKGEALKSDFDKFHIGCVIVYKKHIISYGHNKEKTHPLQKKFNRYRKFNNCKGSYIKHSIHAEIDAISQIPFIVGKMLDEEDGWNKVKIYVWRSTKTKKFACAKPCEACMEMIKSIGIRHLYYTEDYGIAYMDITNSKEYELI